MHRRRNSRELGFPTGSHPTKSVGQLHPWNANRPVAYCWPHITVVVSKRCRCTYHVNWWKRVCCPLKPAATGRSQQSAQKRQAEQQTRCSHLRKVSAGVVVAHDERAMVRRMRLHEGSKCILAGSARGEKVTLFHEQQSPKSDFSSPYRVNNIDVLPGYSNSANSTRMIWERA